MGIFTLLMYGLTYAAIALIAVTLAAGLLIGLGLVAAKSPVPARFILWPIYLAVLVALFPGFLWAALLFGFMTPTFDGHLMPREKQDWRRRGLNDFLELLSAPWKAAGDDAVRLPEGSSSG